MENSEGNAQVQAQGWNKEEMESLISKDTEYLAYQGYCESELAATIRLSAIKKMETFLESVDYHPYVPYMAVVLFDKYVSQNLKMLQDNCEESFHGIILGSLSVAWQITGKEYPVLEIKGIKGIDIEEMDIYLSHAIVLRQRLKQLAKEYVPTWTFICYFSSLIQVDDDLELTMATYDLDGNVKHSEILRNTLAQMAYQMVISNVKNDIKFAKFRLSVIAASALLSSIAHLCPAFYLKSKDGILQKCPLIMEEQLNNCIRHMSMHKLISSMTTVHSLETRWNYFTNVWLDTEKILWDADRRIRFTRAWRTLVEKLANLPWVNFLKYLRGH